MLFTLISLKVATKYDMNRIEIKDFSIKIDKDKVLKTLGCFEGSSVYETVSSYFDELEETVMNLLSPRAVAVTEDMKAYCILTVGEKISGISKSFFDNGEGMKGILVDAMADEYLFMMDDVLAEINYKINIVFFIKTIREDRTKYE